MPIPEPAILQEVSSAILLIDKSLHTYPPSVIYPTGIPYEASSSQAIYRWTGIEWEKIKVSIWDGATWILV